VHSQTDRQVLVIIYTYKNSLAEVKKFNNWGKYTHNRQKVIAAVTQVPINLKLNAFDSEISTLEISSKKYFTHHHTI